MALLSLLDSLFLVFFIVHIPITLLIDINGTIVPRSFYPQVLQDVTEWYATEFQDFLMQSPPIWFRSFIYFELFFQLPLLIASLYGLWTRKSWARVTCLIYGVHVTTSCIPIMAEFCFSSLPIASIFTLVAIYAPYVIIPGLMAFRFAIFPFPHKEVKKKKQ